MLISHHHRFAFIHVPKTGGSSVARALWSFADHPEDHWANRCLAAIGIRVNNYAPMRMRKFRPHTSAAVLRRTLPAGMFESMFTFAFVRNPWDLLVSYFHFLRDAEGHSSHVHHRRGLAARLPDFEAYVRYEIRRGKISQTRMVADNRGRVLVEYLGRYESLADDFAHACRRIGIEAVLGRANVSVRGDYRDYYTDRLAALVRDAYAEDVERFGYEFAAPGAATPALRRAG
ncbi:MAG: sulfotransferase family 2 domain-containing protein [Planctomycetaceae bacterium]